MNGSFTALDLVVLIAYLAGTTALGLWLGRGQKDAKDYFVADREIPWWAVLFSVVASETSALTFISIPSLAYITSPNQPANLGFLQVAAGYLIGRIVVAYTLLPRYYEGELVTAYALLERRFGLATRRFASIVFMATRAFADSVRVFATAIPVALILSGSVPGKYVMPLAIVILGVLTAFYTYYGGMRAVVWTDVLQTCVYLTGAVGAMVLLGRLVPGGWGAILTQGAQSGHLQLLDFSPRLDRPHTVWAGLIGGAFLSMASHGADQLIVQRLLSASSLADARKALIGSGIAVIFQFTLFLLIGVGLFVYYGGRPFATADAIFPTFIIQAMPAGVTGLIVAAILAATMSSHSGAINSLAASTTLDIYVPLTRRSADHPSTLRMAKLFTLLWGAALTGAALLYKQQGTPVVVVALSIASFTYGGLLGGFSLALFWRRATQRDAITGMAIGIAAMSLVVFAKPLSATYPALAASLAPLAQIAWPWYVLIGTTITFVAGALSSITHSTPQPSPTTR